MIKNAIGIRSYDVDELAEFVEKHYAPAAIIARGRRSEIGRLGASLTFEGMRFEWAKTIGEYDIVPKAPLDAIMINCNRSGGLLVEKKRNSIFAGTGEILTFVGENVERVHNLPGSRHATVCIDRPYAKERISFLLEKRVTEPVIFEALIDVNKAFAGKFAALAHSIKFNGLFDNYEPPKTVADAFGNFIIDSALGLLPNNYSGALATPPLAISAKSLKTAVEFIHENLAEIPSVDCLARMSGVSVRSLQYAFKSHFGIGVMEYQRKIRFARVEKELRQYPHETIETVARRWGFNNMGRFGQDFRKIFGETPSKLRKRK